MRQGAAVAASVALGAEASVALGAAWGNSFNSLKHLVGEGKQHRRHFNAKRPALNPVPWYLIRGKFDTPGDRVVAARVPSLLRKPGWCMLRKNSDEGPHGT
jgi:hypothetical protein